MVAGDSNLGDSHSTAGERQRRWRWMGWTLVPLALLIIWELSARRIQQPWMLPRVTEVLDQLTHPGREHYASGTLYGSILISLLRIVIGFVLAAVVGVTVGLLLGAVRRLGDLFEPLVEILRPLCPIAWLPFAIAVFKMTTVPQMVGIQHSQTLLDQVQLGTVFVLFWGAFFPIVVNTIDGVRGVRRDYVRLAWSLGARGTRLFRQVYLPGALPMILTGLRQGIGLCWFVIIAAEMLPGSDSGIGYLLIQAADQSDMDVVITAMLAIGVIGAALNGITLWATRAAVRWHGKEV